MPLIYRAFEGIGRTHSRMSPLAGAQGSARLVEAEAARPIGIARLSKLAFDGADLTPLWRALLDRFVTGADEAGTLMDLATLEQLFGNVEGGLACQRLALERARLYRAPAAAERPALRLLALAAPGDIGVNTPLEFLLEGSDVALDTLYVVPGGRLPQDLPACDLAIVAVGESDANRSVLDHIAKLAVRAPVPVLNDPRRVAALSRERVAKLLDGVPGLLAPPTRRVGRASLLRIAQRHFPLIVRPVDSHAGRGLARIADRAALEAYLAARPEPRFFVAPFVDYRSADGLYRKHRIAFIDGAPYACHMAIADQWMIYYLNAGMRESAAKRDQEARFMRDFAHDFARRHGPALAAIADRIGLDYFAIDCGELPDGRLILFEADIAMIVHAMDPPDIFPYKLPQMRTVFDAFRAMLLRRAGAPA
jgi:glutathione synthase/RimK-type ligase-like ATP-grasp enzyme